MKHVLRVTATASLALALAACQPTPADEKAGGAPGAERGLEVLSNRADLVSGGDVLVAAAVPAGTQLADVSVRVNGVDTQAEFGFDATGRLVARVSGLPVGSNVLHVQARGFAAKATVVNHPNEGPVFSGPQVQPWNCPEGALDAGCNQPAQYSFLYKSTDPTVTGLQPYDPENPPDDVAQTTTDQGVTLPFIVRQELGYQDRDQYKILTLFRPDTGWQPWSPQDQWNHKVLVTHGGGCGSAHGAGNAPLNDFSGTLPVEPPGFVQSYITALGRGFAVASTALDNLGHNCNVVLAAESLVMVKERLVEQYGPIRYTIGTGCSGGSITQMMVANAYPGVYQGSITTCAYPDVFTTGTQFADLHMLRRYFEPSQSDASVMWGTGVIWTPDQMAAVEGNISHLNAITTDELFFKDATAPTGTCAGDDTYDPATNPGGVRCGLMDFLVNLLGTRATEVWSPMELAAGKGFAGNPIDNAGVQYGLNALRMGRITPAQFIDLNARVGGLDIDIQPQAARTVADQPALANVYRTGELNSANNLNRTAIINVSGPDPGAAHDTVHGFWTRRRLDREHGNHDNHVLWAGPVPILGDLQGMNNGLLAMDAWLAAVEADARDLPLAEKLTANKPASLHDQCTDGQGHALAGPECIAPYELAAAYASPRAVAGAPATDDVAKCRLKPFSRDDDYGLLPFTEEQWQQLEQVFAGGVCDFSQPGESQQGAVEWMTYQAGSGAVITGGTPMPAAPAGSGTGWASPAFGVFH